ncbi:DUF1446-domain-containing protein [Mytilinidion resinicola]|uniref:DUF1446-domain-containing protein n=1 Tax=Mytilinidion resinicola TaxID=574789 RepID=A0A6A6YHT2_9PEZI|nr:DUF1446-domain-containing protein [Mytilinidion resinicola]KAF2808386.1 DUF1446-domain-containing protein [Mytilinidion resinicola]
MSYETRWNDQRGKRPVRIANCSGYKADPGYHMKLQAELGDVDFITGDYLAEVNIAENAEAFTAGSHPGYEQTAWDGLEQTIDILAKKRTKVIINGGAQNPKGLAERTHELVTKKGHSLTVAYVEDDNFLSVMKDIRKNGLPPHLDSVNSEINFPRDTLNLLEDESRPVVSANAYLGAREIVKGLELGADIIICGRVADASPVIGAAWYWYSWSETDYDRLAGALIAGHLIECSAYVTGSNFAGFYEYDLDSLYDLVFGIAEVEKDGSCIITKHENGKGMVTEDTVKCQFLYELQGNIYLNSDVKGILDEVKVEQVGKNRVRLSGIRGAPPPPTTKLAIFYRAGYQSELLLNATGYATKEKWDLYERMLRFGLKRRGILDKFDILEVGIPAPNAPSQLASTTYLRIFAEASSPATNLGLAATMSEFSMQHFSGFHCTSDQRLALPKPYLSFYPALYPQRSLKTSVTLLRSPNNKRMTYPTTAPPKTEPLAPRETYDCREPSSLSAFGPTRAVRLGDIALARSGDKGANLNIGVFLPTALPSSLPASARPDAWSWLRSFLSVSKMKELLGEDWREAYYIERVEFAGICAVHFVVYGILGKGVSGSARLDGLGKGVADWIRDRVVEVPVRFLEVRGSGETPERPRL